MTKKTSKTSRNSPRNQPDPQMGAPGMQGGMGMPPGGYPPGMGGAPGMQGGMPGAMPPGMAQGMKAPKMDAQQSKYLALVRQLTESAGILVVKVATCKCKEKENCKVFTGARSIADNIEALQEVAKEGVSVGKARRKTRT